MKKSLHALIIISDLIIMSFNFSALTLFSSLSNSIIKLCRLSISEAQWASALFTVGVFFAFLIGHSRYFEVTPRLAVMVSGLSVSIPQFVIPLLKSFWPIALLRVIQGLAMVALPVFSYQAGLLFPNQRTLAIGVIVSGIFIGGLLGSTLGPYLNSHTGLSETFYIIGAVTLILTLLYSLLIPKESLPPRMLKQGGREMSVWKYPFTWIWGFTFFPGLWIVFTLAPLIHFISESMYGVSGIYASTVLESSYILWSLIPGLLLIAMFSVPVNAKSQFRSIALIQVVHYLIPLLATITIVLVPNLSNFTILLILLASIQGTAPTFWSIQTLAYPKNLAPKAGYALGLISNSAALVGPIATLIIKSLGPTNIWILNIVLEVIGVTLTLISLRIKLPIESYVSK